MPKAALYSHGRFWQNLLSTVIDTPGMGYNDIWLGPVPLYHIGGFATLIRAFLMSNTVILRDSFDPEAFLQTIEKEKATILYAYPTMIHALVNHPEAKKFDLSSLRLVVYGGSGMPLATLHKAFEVFTDQIVHGMEGLCITTQEPDELRRRWGFKETPIIRLVREKGSEKYISPTNLPMLFMTIKSFVESSKNSIVLIDSMEHLIRVNENVVPEREV